jgi:alpha-tubulin suppressor-like RCC1 family protein
MVIYSAEINNNLINQIECGDNFSGFVTEGGTLYTFGNNQDGQLAVGM